MIQKNIHIVAQNETFISSTRFGKTHVRNITSNLHLLRVVKSARHVANWIRLEHLSRVNLTWDLRGSVALESKWLCPSCASIGFDDC